MKKYKSIGKLLAVSFLIKAGNQVGGYLRKRMWFVG